MYSLFYSLSGEDRTEMEQEAAIPSLILQVSEKTDDSTQLPTRSDLMPSDVPLCIDSEDHRAPTGHTW